jgi:hypothetical protein
MSQKTAVELEFWYYVVTPQLEQCQHVNDKLCLRFDYCYNMNRMRTKMFISSIRTWHRRVQSKAPEVPGSHWYT